MRTTIVFGLCSLIALSALGCSHDDKADQRRALLKPKDTLQKLRDEREKMRKFDDQGDLLPSDTATAGIVLPRGLELHRSFEREWYYKARGISMEQLERYFGPKLSPTGLERNATSVTYESATLKDDPHAMRVTVRIGALKGSVPASEIYIKQAAPARTFPSASEAEAQLKARQAHAD